MIFSGESAISCRSESALRSAYLKDGSWKACRVCRAHHEELKFSCKKLTVAMIVDMNSELFRDELLVWFRKNQRDLPWRRTYDPYHVWISEVMLQQTQMERGVEYFSRWIEQFPDPQAISAASEQEVLKAWEGLGYYSRARNIRKTAALLVKEHGNRLPDEYGQLLALPGIGPYTAGAIMSIAFNKPYPVVDANVERLFARLDDIDRPMKEKTVRQNLHGYLQSLLLDSSPRNLNQALMELGALICTPANPECSECPVRHHCVAQQNGTVALRPVSSPRPEKIDIVMACTIIVRDGRYFIQQRQDDDVWGGLWEFPGGRLKDGETPDLAAERELFEETEMRALNLRPFKTVTHHYTRYRVTLHGFFCETSGQEKPALHAARQNCWVSLEELEQYAFPSGHRQLIEHMKKVSSIGFGAHSASCSNQ